MKLKINLLVDSLVLVFALVPCFSGSVSNIFVLSRHCDIFSSSLIILRIYSLGP